MMETRQPGALSCDTVAQWGDEEDKRLCSGTYCTAESPCLFDVVADQGKRHDIAQSKSDVVIAMQKRLQEIQKRVLVG